MACRSLTIRSSTLLALNWHRGRISFSVSNRMTRSLTGTGRANSFAVLGLTRCQMSSTRKTRLTRALFLVVIAMVVTSCRQDMHDQPKLKTYREGADRAPVEGTVPRGALKDDVFAPKATPAA